MRKIMDGKKLADEIKAQVKKDVGSLNKHGIDVGLALMLVGNNPASQQYFLATRKACKKVDIHTYEYRLPVTVATNEILNVVNSINQDERINGLLVLFPLPARINSRRIINAISTEKDVDGLGSVAIGRLAADESTFQIFHNHSFREFADMGRMPTISSFLPCTPHGVMRLLEFYGIEVKGKNAVVIGKSLAVGKPLSLMLLAKEATVTICHRGTGNIGNITRQADILCSATGVKGLIKGDMVKDGAVVVDIGINVLDDGRIVGDIDFESVAEKAGFITPVPGGVGPVTIAMLLENTVKSAQRSEWLKSPFMI